jgi:glutaryl-CoA dehydrogenase
MTGGDVDYYGLEELLGEEERLTRASVRSFVEREALPLLEDCHAREEFPRALIPRMAELGLFGASLKGYGCAGLSGVAYGLIMQELEAGDSGLR